MTLSKSTSAASVNGESDASYMSEDMSITDVTIQEALKLLGLNTIVAPQCSFERSVRKVSSKQFNRWKNFQVRLKEIGIKSLQPFPEDFTVEEGRRFYRIQVAVDLDEDDECFPDDASPETVGGCLRTRNAIKGMRVISSLPAPVTDIPVKETKKPKIPPAKKNASTVKKRKSPITYKHKVAVTSTYCSVQLLCSWAR